MARYLIDVNLPYHFSLWRGPEYEHVRDLNDAWTDRQIWEYARDREMVIVSKDADFSDMAMVYGPPPRVIHVRFGNMRMRDLHQALARHWPWIMRNIPRFRLIRVYPQHVEGVSDAS